MLRSRAFFVVLSLSCACAGAPHEGKEPMGTLPSANTKAEASWVPFGIRAGRAVEGDPREARMFELRQLTFDDESGTPVWHPDGRHLVYQNGRAGETCSEIHRIDLATGKAVRLSPDKGWSGGASYTAAGRLVLAHAASAAPPCSKFGDGVRWALPDADLLEVPLGYTAEPKVLASAPGFDGDATVAGDGRIVFTSTRDNDAELYLLRPGGGPAQRLTQSPGYDGRARISRNGARLVWQAERSGEPGDAPRAAMERGSMAPRLLEIFIGGTEGQNARALTRHGALSITPSFLPDSRHVLYASDFDDPRRKAPARAGEDVYDEGPTAAHDFEIYLVDPDGAVTAGGGPRVERITYSRGFDGEAVVSPDGHYIAFSSSRHSARGTNVFVARWHPDDD